MAVVSRWTDEDWEDWTAIDPDRMNPVSSSHLTRVKYSRNLQLLAVEFTDGSVWVYDGVDQGTYQAMLRAGSIGSYFHYNIRTTYPYEQVI